MRGQIRIEGMDKLRRNIARLDKGMQRRVYNKAVRAAGKVVVDAAKGMVPRNTGTLAGSLVHRASSKPRHGLFGVRITVKGGKLASGRTANRRGRSGASYRPDAVERYYRFTELGTKYHAAKPYLKPALQGNAGEVLAVIRRELRAGLERETRGLAK